MFGKYRIELDNNHPILVSESETEYEPIRVNDSNDAAAMMKEIFRIHKQAEEHVCMICFNIQMKPIGAFDVFHGTANMCTVSLREIFIRALICGAVSIIVAHNHPSGETTPSKEDLEFTSKLKEAGKLLGIAISDSLIVTENGHYSMI